MTPQLTRLIASQVFVHAAMAGVRMATPLLALRQGYGPAAVGALLALFALTQVFLSIPAGRYADRHGLHRLMHIAIAAAFFGATLAAVLPVYGALCVTALCLGGAVGGVSIALQRHVGRIAEGATELKRVFSWLSIGPAFSNFIGPFSAGVVIDAVGAWLGGESGYRAAFFMLALMPLLSWWCLRPVAELPPVTRPADAARLSAWDLLRDPMMRRLLLVNWLLASAWDVHTFVVPLLGHERGLPASVIGTILGAFAMAAVLVRLMLPLVASRVREWAMIVGAMVGTVVLFVIYPFAPGPWTMGLCSVLLGFHLGVVQPMVMSTLHQITPEHRQGEALGLRLVAINASSVLMPLLFGTAGSLVGVSGVFWAVAAMLLAGARGAAGLKAADLDAKHNRKPK